MFNYIIIQTMKKVNFKWLYAIFIAVMSLSLLSCGDHEEETDASIVGTWVQGNITLTFGKDGSYKVTNITVLDSGKITTKQNGTYSFNSNSGLLVVNVSEGKDNIAYQRTYIVQTLTSTTLVLLYTDGDVNGYYTRK